MRIRPILLLILLSGLLFGLPVGAAQQVDGVRLWTAPDHTRVVFDISGPIEHKVFSLTGPDRLVIDLADTAIGNSPDPATLKDRFIGGVRWGKRGSGDLRVVLDLNQPIRPKSFVLRPNDSYGHRLVIDIFGKAAASERRVVKSTSDLGRHRDVVVAIDAGHGGEDPGALGEKRTKEKHITLQIAQRLKRLIDARPGMRAVLTRDGDYYVGLRKRMAIARDHRADLFVSIHADAFHDKRVHGSSVYVVSRRGASSEAARWLAQRENASDLVGGVSLDDKDDVLASVLLDLSQSATRQASLTAADSVYRQLRGVGKTHGKRVQKAGFVVLKSPDIPSMLVETGFISNPAEEHRLRDPNYQQRLASAVFAGVEDFLTRAPPPGTLLAEQRDRPAREHVIRHGDTLTEIAQQYQVSLGRLRRENELSGDVIRIGQVLRIPET